MILRLRLVCGKLKGVQIIGKQLNDCRVLSSEILKRKVYLFYTARISVVLLGVPQLVVVVKLKL